MERSAADASDYLGRLTDLYGTYGTYAVNSIVNLYTDNSSLQQYQTIEDFSKTSHGIQTLHKWPMHGKFLKSLTLHWASSVAGIGGVFL